MYYPQQSPGISHKLPNHHDQNPWPRPHHPVLGPPGQQPNVGPPPPSPGYAIYTNGNVNPMQHLPHHPHPLPPMQHHHHQNSLSHYPSPPNGHTMQQHVLPQGSPASSAGQVISPHWQQQLLKCEVRSAYIHHPLMFSYSFFFVHRRFALPAHLITVLARVQWLHVQSRNQPSPLPTPTS
jgi:CCR4-NOT transcription complex subunit 6